MVRQHPGSPLFPYTTLFRSDDADGNLHHRRRLAPGEHRIARPDPDHEAEEDRKSTRLNSSHANISYAVFCLKKKKVALDIELERGPVIILTLVAYTPNAPEA